MPILVDLDNVTVRRSDRVLFESLSLTVADGDRVGIVGINGTGKSTLLRVVAGVEPPESGEVRRGNMARIGYLEQEPRLREGTVREAVGSGWEAEELLERLGMGALIDSELPTLSGGEAKRVALAAVLAAPAELLVLDEPTNHVDLRTISWLEQRLLGSRAGLVLVSHDRHLLDRLTTKMVELDRGHVYVHEGGYDSYLESRIEREERAAAADASRRNLARRELTWLRRGAPARTRKPQARIDAARAVIEKRMAAPARASALDASFGTPRLGDKVLEAVGVEYRYNDTGTPTVCGVDLSLDRRERLGVVGANGTGKSTLLDLLAGRKQPSAGRVEVGATAVIGYYDQKGATLDPGARVRDLVAGPTRAPGAPEDIALMERFWFTGELPFARVATLSGGEKRRLQLLLVLAERPNVLLLDEPTNDLDLDTLRGLEDFFEEWPGALVVVSHDRTFLGRTTDRLVALDATGSANPVVGGLEAWVAAAEQPRGRAHARRSLAPVGHVDPVLPRSSRSPSTLGRLLRDADKEMARLTRKRDELAAALGATRDHGELARLGGALAEAQAELDESEHRWLALAEEDEGRR